MASLVYMLLVSQIIYASAYETVYGRYVNRPRQDTQVIYDKWVNFDSVIQNLTSSALKNLLPSVLDLSGKLNLTSKCTNQGFYYLRGVKKLQIWAVRMVDSTSKSIDGLLSGTLSSFGNFDECIDTVVMKKNQDNVYFRGKYCDIHLHPPPHLEERTAINAGLGNYSKFSELTLELLKNARLLEMDAIKMAVCIPSGCTSEDLQKILNYAGELVPLTIKVGECQTKKEPHYDISTCIAIFVYSMPVFLVIIGTLLDHYSKKNEIKFQNKTLQTLQAFSFPKNYKKLMATEESDQTLPCLHGFRFLTILWVMINHNYLFALFSLTSHENGLKYINSMQNIFMQVIFNAEFSVDTFFFLGGLLNSYSRMKAEEKGRSSNVLVLVRRRLWRIYPTYVIALLTAFLIPLLGSGPFFYFAENFKGRCEEQWWHCLLFVNNYGGDIEKMCYPHTWYLAADMQLFLIALITIYPLLKWPRIGVILNVATCVLFVIFSTIWYWLKDYPPIIIFNRPLETYTYFNIHTSPTLHGCTYFIGVLIGYLISRKKELKIPKVVQLLGWILSTTVCLLLVSGTRSWYRGVKPTLVESISYAVVGRVVYSLSLSWIVICCVYGYGGIVNRILTWKAWIPLSRITFGTFLLSVPVQLISLASSEAMLEFSQSVMIRRFVVDVLYTIVFSSILFIFVESPCGAAENILLPRAKNTETKTFPANNIPIGDFLNGNTIIGNGLKIEDGFISHNGLKADEDCIAGKDLKIEDKEYKTSD